MADDTPRTIVRAISNLVAYNWADEEADYNHEALEPGNSREGHIFHDLMLIQRWLETFGYPHVEPKTVPPPKPDLIILRTQFGWSLREDDGRPLLEALIASANDPEQLLELARTLNATAELQED